MKDSVLSMMVKCEDCNSNFGISEKSTNITYKRKFLVNGRSIYLTYYDCPNCGRRHYVQIDDDKSLEMLKHNEKQFAHNAALKSRGQKLRKKKIDQYKNSKNQLSNYRLELMKEFSDAIIYDAETNDMIKVRFSV